MAEDISNMIYRLVLRQSLHEIIKKTDINNIVVEAEKISKEKKKETGKKDRKLEQAIEILKLHQPLD